MHGYEKLKVNSPEGCNSYDFNFLVLIKPELGNLINLNKE